MENFSLQDLGIIVGSVVAFLAVCIIMPPLLKYGPRFFVSLFHRYLWVDWDGFMSRLADMDKEPAESDWNGAGSNGTVLPHQNQENQNRNANFETIKNYFTQHNLSDEQCIIILALMRRMSGDDLLSANKIRDVVGGADAVVKAQVSALRPKKIPAKPPALRGIQRPKEGW
jgi:hypothetical protein